MNSHASAHLSTHLLFLPRNHADLSSLSLLMAVQRSHPCVCRAERRRVVPALGGVWYRHSVCQWLCRRHCHERRCSEHCLTRHRWLHGQWLQQRVPRGFALLRCLLPPASSTQHRRRQCWSLLRRARGLHRTSHGHAAPPGAHRIALRRRCSWCLQLVCSALEQHQLAAVVRQPPKLLPAHARRLCRGIWAQPHRRTVRLLCTRCCVRIVRIRWCGPLIVARIWLGVLGVS